MPLAIHTPPPFLQVDAGISIAQHVAFDQPEVVNLSDLERE